MAWAADDPRLQVDELGLEVERARTEVARHPFLGPKRTLARALARYGVALRAHDRLDEALATYVEARALLDELIPVLASRSDEQLAAVVDSLLATVHDQLGDVAAAGRALTSAAAGRRAIVARHPDDPLAVAHLVRALTAHATHVRLNADGAIPRATILEAVTIGREAVGRDDVSRPAGAVRVRRALVDALHELADTATLAGDRPAALVARLEAVRVLRPLLDGPAVEPDDEVSGATALYELARTAMWTGDLVAASEAAEEAVDRLDACDAQGRGVPRELALALDVAGQVATEQGRFDDAADAFARGRAATDRVRPDDRHAAAAVDVMLTEHQARLAVRRHDVVGAVRGLWRATHLLRRFHDDIPAHSSQSARNQFNRLVFGSAEPTGRSAALHVSRNLGRTVAYAAKQGARRLPFPVPGVPAPPPPQSAGVPDDARQLDDGSG